MRLKQKDGVRLFFYCVAMAATLLVSGIVSSLRSYYAALEKRIAAQDYSDENDNVYFHNSAKRKIALTEKRNRTK